MTGAVRAVLTRALAGVCLAAVFGCVLAPEAAAEPRKARTAPGTALPADGRESAPLDTIGTSEPCINVDFIRDTKVKDDQTIRMRMRGGATYEVKLRDKCFGLAFHESFYYQASPTRRLCARYDTIVARSGSRCRIDSITRLNRKPDEKQENER